jgi:hypothetical protein
MLLACGIAAGAPSISAQVSTSPLHYVPLSTPCRAVDTRQPGGGGPIDGGTFQNFIPAVNCSIPYPADGVIAYAMNITVVPHGTLGYITVWPDGDPQPNVSTLNSYDGRVKANAAIVSGGSGAGAISIFASNTTDVVLDISGYFTTAAANYVYVPVTPCRMVDTRINNGTPFGAPSIVGGTQRSFSLAASACGLPAGALANGGALSLNITAIPSAGLNYLTVWGTSPTEPQPPITSTLNAPSNDPVANAAIVSIDEDSSASVSVFASNTTDLLIDVTGYFTTPSIAPSGLSLYENAPCRVLDTRLTTGAFIGQTTIPVAGVNSCAPPTSAKAYVMNATVVPIAGLGYLTLWPAGSAVPVVSTLNAYDGSVTSNMAVVGDTNGAIDAYAYNPTQLILDVSGYFALAPGANLPSVVFIGDDAISQWASNSTAFQQNPNWINKGIAGQTSDQVLARFQADVINLHPAIVNIDVGMNDVLVPGWEPECGAASIPAAATCANIGSMASMAHAAGIKTIVGTIPIDPTGSIAAFGNGELFNRGLRQAVTLPEDGLPFFNTPDTIMVDYMPTYTAGPPIVVTGYDVATPLAETAIALLNGATLQSGYLGTPNSANTIAVGGTIQFTAYGVYSDGVTRAVSNNIYYEGPCIWTSSDNSVMSIDSTLGDTDLGLATAHEAGQVYISANCGGVEFSPWIMTIQ